MDVDDDEAETDEETHAIPAAGRVAAEAAHHINGAAGWEVRHALKPTKRIPSEEEGHQKPDQEAERWFQESKSSRPRFDEPLAFTFT